MPPQTSLLEASEVANTTNTTVLNASRLDQLEAVRAEAATCTKCRLCEGRTNSVFKDGNPNANLMLIGEGPGQNEDETGIPFVGRAGQLLTQILDSVNISRQNDIYICNIVKCRPPQNRKPQPDEMATCWPYLEAQIQAIQPDIILLCGATAVEGVLKIKTGITKIRGQWFETPYHAKDGSITRAMPIFHPSYLLRNQSKAEGSPKWHTWQDMKNLRTALDTLAAGR